MSQNRIPIWKVECRSRWFTPIGRSPFLIVIAAAECNRNEIMLEWLHDSTVASLIHPPKRKTANGWGEGGGNLWGMKQGTILFLPLIASSGGPSKIEHIDLGNQWSTPFRWDYSIFLFQHCWIHTSVWKKKNAFRLSNGLISLLLSIKWILATSNLGLLNQFVSWRVNSALSGMLKNECSFNDLEQNGRGQGSSHFYCLFRGSLNHLVNLICSQMNAIIEIFTVEYSLDQILVKLILILKEIQKAESSSQCGIRLPVFSTDFSFKFPFSANNFSKHMTMIY